uniref:Alpha-N-acetylglucosaminidase n=1 Tax=Anthurium amnicola TaxID=1678845 RepID=A0A1D1YX15_9ARAE
MFLCGDIDRYDLVDLARQALAKYANNVFLRIIEAYQMNEVIRVTVYSQHFLDLVKDLDILLSCHNGFLLGPWLESAKHLAKDSDQEKQLEWNARTQISMWFDNTEVEASLLHDYGNKYWCGLLEDYYRPRAAIYFKYLIESLQTGKSFALVEWRREWIKLTNNWQSSRKTYSVKASGDALNISRWLYDKYLRNTNYRDQDTDSLASSSF